jgi:hypothetical protein
MSGSRNPIIVIGAPRSGTNMLRDVLCALPGFGTWPCDEINYIWRHGNAGFPTDELTPDLATPNIRQYIRRRFDRLAASRRLLRVVEKTCANSLRVGFVDQVIPGAHYIFIVRDARDVVASAMKRWIAPLDLRYVAKKARFVPVSDFPFYAIRYAASRFHRRRSTDRRLSTWGARFSGMQEWLAEGSLAEVCAAQWRRCVELAQCQLSTVEGAHVLQIRYEDFVTRPDTELARVIEFLGAEVTAVQRRAAVEQVSAQSVGKWRAALSSETLAQVAPIVERTLAQFGYQQDERLALDKAA